MKNEPRNLPKELYHRNFKRPNTFLYAIYKVVMHIVGRNYNAHYEIVDDINKTKGPAFVIFNHLSRLDHFYVLEACYPRKLNILAGYNEFFRSHLAFAFKMNQLLPKKQYVNDTPSTKIMMRVLQKGGTIAFAPEGLASNDGMNKPIVPGTGKLFKHFKVPVYFCELHGQYLQNTKVCLDERYGETYAKLQLLFSPEDFEKLSGEEIDDIINRRFCTDEYEWQKEKHIRWETRGRICQNLEELLYRCPKCGTELQMTGEGNTIRCKCCGNGATMDDYYDFHPFDGSCVIPSTPSEWARQERADVIRKIRTDPGFVFEEKVRIGKIPKDHLVKDKKTSEIVGSGLLTLDHSGLRYKGNENATYDFDLDWRSLFTAIAEVDLSYFNLYIGGEYTDIFPERPSSYLFFLLIEEMHRFHVNYYKNFSWNKWMYEGLPKTPEDI